MPSEAKTLLTFFPTPCQRTWSDFFHNRWYLGYDIYPVGSSPSNGLPIGALYQDDFEQYYFSSKGRGLGRLALMEIADKLEELNHE